MTKTRHIKEPSKEDLIYIKRPTSGVLTSSEKVENKLPWSSAIVTLEPNQTALVLQTYKIDKQNYHPHTNANELIEEWVDGHEYHQNRRYFHIIILSIGDNVIETLYDPNYMDIITSPASN
jgi:hypothetical protein